MPRINLSSVPLRYVLDVGTEISGDIDPQKVGLIWGDLEPVAMDRYSPTGDIKVKRNADAVRQAVMNIISTRLGQLIHEPTFGCNIEDELFEPMSEENGELLGRIVVNAIELWEDRVTIQSLYVNLFPEENKYDLTIAFTIRGLGNETFNVNSAISR